MGSRWDVRAVVLALAAGCNGNIGGGRPMNANQQHAIANMGCGLGQKSAAEQRACYARADSHYVVNSQRDAEQRQIDREDQRQRDGEAAARWSYCEAVVANMMSCRVIVPAAAFQTTQYCASALEGRQSNEAYGQTRCMGAARDCEGVAWCLNAGTPVAHPAPARSPAAQTTSAAPAPRAVQAPPTVGEDE